MPRPSMSIRHSASSKLRLASPRKIATVGPNFTRMVPHQTPSPWSVASSAPGIHDATTAGSRNSGQTRSHGEASVLSSFSETNGSGIKAGLEPPNDAPSGTPGNRGSGIPVKLIPRSDEKPGRNVGPREYSRRGDWRRADPPAQDYRHGDRRERDLPRRLPGQDVMAASRARWRSTRGAPAHHRPQDHRVPWGSVSSLRSACQDQRPLGRGPLHWQVRGSLLR